MVHRAIYHREDNIFKCGKAKTTANYEKSPSEQY